MGASTVALGADDVAVVMATSDKPLYLRPGVSFRVLNKFTRSRILLYFIEGYVPFRRECTMSTDVHDILEAVRALPLHEQLAVMQGLAQSLSESVSPPSSPTLIESANSNFWRTQTVEELAHDQQTPIYAGPGDLQRFAMPEWPADETIDDLIQFLHDQRREDRQV